MKRTLIAAAATLAIATPTLAQQTTYDTATQPQVQQPEVTRTYPGFFARGIEGVNPLATRKLRENRTDEPHRVAD